MLNINIKRIILIIALLFLGGFIHYCWTSFGYYLSPWGRAHARAIAEKYLDNNYEQKFVFYYLRAPIVDPVYYHVGFISMDGFLFEVFVTSSHQLFADTDESFSSDDYFFCRFDFECKNEYEKIVSSLTKQKYELTVISDLKPIINNKTEHAEFNEYMSFEQLADLLTWKCYLTLESTPFAEDTSTKVEQIEAIIAGIKSSALLPNELKIKYTLNDNSCTEWMTFTDLGSLRDSEIESIIIENLNVS